MEVCTLRVLSLVMKLALLSIMATSKEIFLCLNKGLQYYRKEIVCKHL